MASSIDEIQTILPDHHPMECKTQASKKMNDQPGCIC